MPAAYYIYGLVDERGNVYYVGVSNCPDRRMKEHKRKFGHIPEYIIIEECGADWRECECKWIMHYREVNPDLLNLHAGGNGKGFTSEATRARLSRSLKGLEKPRGFGEKLSRAQKGQLRAWSDEGKKRVAQGQFPKGHKKWETLPPEKKETIRAASRAVATGLTSEERSRRNRIGWASMTPEQRAERGRAISAAQKSSDKLREAARTPERREKTSLIARAFWKNMTPEYRADYLMRREASRQVTLARKRELADR